MSKRLTLDAMLRMELPAPKAEGPTVLSTLGDHDMPPLVREAIAVRTAIGVERYGVPLHVHDGRHAADAGQEAGDLANYLARHAAQGDKASDALLARGGEWLADVLAWACGGLAGVGTLDLPCLHPSSGKSLGWLEWASFTLDGETEPCWTVEGDELKLQLPTAGCPWLEVERVPYDVERWARHYPAFNRVAVDLVAEAARRLLRDLLAAGWKVTSYCPDDQNPFLDVIQAAEER